MINWNGLESIGPNERVTEASDLGLRSGHWPASIVIRDDHGHLTFHRDVSLRNHENDIIQVTYKCSSIGLKLTIWND